MQTPAIRRMWMSMLAVALVTAPAFAHDLAVSLSGTGVAVIDGVMSPGEWDSAESVDLSVNVPAFEGGGATPATLYVMNDNVNLYIGLKIARTGLGGSTNVNVEFENDHDGLREVGDDVVVANRGQFQEMAEFFDDYRATCIDPPGDPGSTGCGPADTAPLSGPPGTNDGDAAIANDGAFTFVEIEHPLDSADDSHDFSLSAGNTVGFHLFVRLYALDLACSEKAADALDCLADTEFPSAFGQTDRWGDMIISPFGPRECARACVDAARGVFDACIAEGERPGRCALTGLRFLGECLRSCRE